MKITIIFDNEVWKEGLRAGWGFFVSRGGI